MRHGSRAGTAPAASTDGEPFGALAALIVDASDNDAELVASVLEGAGYLAVRWRRVADPAAMRASLAGESWDVVLCDHRIPAFDSFDALAVLQASGLDLPLIVVSSALGEETALAAIRAGAADSVSKERLDRLGGAVRTCVRQVEERRLRRASERAVRESQSRFQASLEALIDAFMLVSPLRDPDGRIVDFVLEYVNDAACEANGLAREQLVGMRLLELFTELASVGLLGAFTTVFESGERLALDDFRYVGSIGAHAGERYFDLRASKAQNLLELTWRNVTIRHHAEAEHARLAEIVRASNDAIVSVDAERRITSWNSAAAAIYGYSAEEVLGRSSDLLIPPDAVLESPRLHQEPAAGSAVLPYETQRVAKAGTLVDVAITAFPLIDAAGNVYGAASIERDITDRKLAERALAESEGRYREILDTTPDGVWLLDTNNRTDYINPRMASMLGYLPEEMIGREPSEFMQPGAPEQMQEAITDVPGQGRLAVVDQCFVRKDGSRCWARVTHATLTDLSGNHTGAMSIMSDITESKAQESELRATEDFLAALTDSMAEGMFAMNGDGRVNYMNRAAERLLGWAKGDLALEAIHTTSPTQHDDGTPYAAARCPVMSALRTGASVRVDDSAFARSDGRLLPVAYSAAPVTAGDDAHGIVVVFSDVSARRAEEQRREGELETLNWVGRIRDALDEKRLVLHAQPIIDLPSREVATYELLVRIVDRDGAMIAPAHFLPAAEQFGLIEEIDGWVLDEAVRLAALGLKVHFNISGRSLGSHALIGALVRSLHDTGADPALLVCEITETALATDKGVAEAFVHQLAQLGCGIALDDFGMGYGGFAYLKRLPVTILKIDQEFVRDLLDSSKNQHIVKAIANLAKGFGRTTIAEGVETNATLALLEEYGVDCAQGFAIGRPRPVETMLTASTPQGLPTRFSAPGSNPTVAGDSNSSAGGAQHLAHRTG